MALTPLNLYADIPGFTEFDFGVQYVHPEGADSNTGFTPSTPKATVEAAYADLPETGGTIILASNARHDIGDGLDLDRRKNACLKSVGRHKRNRGAATDPTSNALIYSSTNAATMLNSLAPAASTMQGDGFEFRGVDFEVPPVAGVTVFDMPGLNHLLMDDCGFYHGYTDTAQAPFKVLNANHAAEGSDSSWWRVTNNYVRGGQLAYGVGFGLNQWVIRDNVCFGVNLADPFIYMENGHRLTIRDNNLEGASTSAGVFLKGCNASWVGNSGEATSPMVVLENSHGNQIQDMGVVAPSISKVVARLLGSSGNNIIILSVVTALSNLYNQGIDDQTGNADNTFIMPSSSKARNVIQMPGLRIAGVELVGAVKGKAGDVGVKATSVEPPFLYFKISDDHGVNGWRKMSFDAPDTAGPGFKSLRTTNT